MEPSLIVDIHETKTKVFNYIFNSSEINYEIKNLFIGDYIAGGVVIERKTVSDFLNSMKNQRLKEQVRKLLNTEKRLLIVEGSLSELNPIDKKRFYGYILSLLLHKNLKFVFTENAWNTYNVLLILIKQKISSNEKVLEQSTSRIPKPLENLKYNVISNIYNIGPVNAKKLIEKFGSIKNIINANENNLNEILGSKTKQFLEIIEK